MPRAAETVPGAGPPPLRYELGALLIALLVALIVLCAAYASLYLFGAARAASRAAGPRARFLAGVAYHPTCGGAGDGWRAARRGACGGLTSGRMPAIDVEHVGGLCAGYLLDGVPP